MPKAASSWRQKQRAKKPRLSVRGSVWTTSMPGRGREIRRMPSAPSRLPRAGARLPKALHLLAVAQGVDARPEAAVPVDPELAVAGQAPQRLLLEDAVLVGGDVVEEAAAEEEAAIDDVVGAAGLLGEAGAAVLVQGQPAELRRRLHAQDRAEPAVADMEAQLVGEVGVGEAIAVGHAEMLRLAQVAPCRPGQSGAGHRADAGERHG